MANRAYLYSLSNRPTSFQDRPETISGLSEWAYVVPFSYLVLASGDPRLCASLVTDGFEDDPPERRTPLHAISAEFDTGYARLVKLGAVLRAASGGTPGLTTALEETETFLAGHRDRYVLLETIELDAMDEESEEALRACAERWVARCRQAGAAIDALPDDMAEAAVVLRQAAAGKAAAPLDAFRWLVLNDRFDDLRDLNTEYPLGLSWSEVLYFDLWNRAELAANA